VTAHQAEAVVLRKWPVHEADEIVSLFTRSHGRIRGVAKAAAKSRRRFGGALEPMTWVTASYVERPKQDLVRLDACEVLSSPLSDPVNYARAAALAFYAEVLEEALPDHDPHEAVFRLVLAVLEQTRDMRIWMPVTYFSLWITRLLGWMPSLTHCTLCGEAFGAEAAWFEAWSDGLVCSRHKQGASRALCAESLALARRIFQSPVAALAAEDWPANRAADLRRFTSQALERHLERKLHSAAALSKLGEGTGQSTPTRRTSVAMEVGERVNVSRANSVEAMMCELNKK
jgi:DNA repair protein RecO (recombination protein O)